MTINDEHIKEAEDLLIGGQEFDKNERVPFIKSLKSIDLLAVPGSGKTTALIAKLYCLSKHLPFNDGSGILVLSHTNAAVGEIEKHLKPICPMLFSYPNFIGTIQGFVNKYFVNPYYSQVFDCRSLRIDDGIYFSEISNALANDYSSEVGYFKNRNKAIFYDARFWFDENMETIIANGISQTLLYIPVPQKWVTEQNAESKRDKVLKFIKNTKIRLIKQGILHYDDCYYIAMKYISKMPEIISLLQSRFRYVLIDEMQDLEKFQIDFIDKVFLSEDSPTIIQRIGDINQSIYNSGKKVKVTSDWQPRNPMFLNDSNRLTSEISTIVNLFTLDRQKDEHGNPRFIVNGLRQIENPIKPHLIIFNEETKDKLEGCFESLIISLSLDSIPEAEKYGFKIIGWNAKWDGEEEHNNKLRLEDIFTHYKKDGNSNKETFSSISKYLQCFDRSKKTLEPSRKAILNALIAVLRFENKTYKINIRGKDVDRFYTKNELIRVIQKRVNSDDYTDFKFKLYSWSFLLSTNQNLEDVYNSIRLFIQNDFKVWFELAINQDSQVFLGEQFVKINLNSANSTEGKQKDVKIDIGTVHSAKGETHCATMYVETSYHDYETNKLRVLAKKATKTRPEVILPNPLLGQEHSYREDKDKFAKQTLKMMYVGFSRPTHLLCFAALKDHVGESLEEYTNAGWEIIDLTIAT